MRNKEKQNMKLPGLVTDLVTDRFTPFIGKPCRSPEAVTGSCGSQVETRVDECLQPQTFAGQAGGEDTVVWKLIREAVASVGDCEISKERAAFREA